MNAAAFASECSRRGFALSLATVQRGGYPFYAVKIAGRETPPPKVLDTIRRHKPAIIDALRDARSAEWKASRAAPEPAALPVTAERTARDDTPRDASPEVRGELSEDKCGAFSDDAELRALAAELEADFSRRDPETAARLERCRRAERGANVHVCPDGSRLYEDARGRWGYVPPFADPADFVENFPPNLRETARRRYAPRRPMPKAVHPDKCGAFSEDDPFGEGEGEI